MTAKQSDIHQPESTLISVSGATCDTPDNCHHCGDRIRYGEMEFIVVIKDDQGQQHESLACEYCIKDIRRSHRK